MLTVVALLAVLAWWMNGTRPAPDSVLRSTEVNAVASQVSDNAPMEVPAGLVNQAKAATQIASVPRTRIDRAAEILALLNAPGRIQDRIRLAISHGGVDDSVIGDFLFTAKASCDPRHLERLAASPFSADQSRQWAIGSLVEACQGFDPTEFQETMKYGYSEMTASDVLIKFGEEPARQAAVNAIQDRDDFRSLVDAGRVLNELNGFPASLPVSMNELGTDERFIAWSVASNLYQCTRSSSDVCAASSLNTLTHCAQAGCRPNSDLRSAFSQTLSPRVWAAAQTYLFWIQSQKNHG